MKIQQGIEIARRVIERTKSLGPLWARVAVGVVFAMTGWGKLHNLDTVGEFFANLGLPAPTFMAALVATTEFVGGSLLIIGLASRLAALPLAVTMTVALATAKRSEIEGLTSLFNQIEFLYLTIFVWIALAGPGALALDRLVVHLAKKRWFHTAATSQENVAIGGT